MIKLNKPVAKNPDKAMTGKMPIIYTDHPDFEKRMKEGKIATGEPATPDPKAIARFAGQPGEIEITKPACKR